MGTKIFHAADIHYCPKHLVEVNDCFRFAVDRAIQENCQAAILAGDLFDHALDMHSPAALAAMRQVTRLAKRMPVFILQGTFSHDVPGMLQAFEITNVATVIDYPVQFLLIPPHHAALYDPHLLENAPDNAVLLSFLPTVSKADLAASVGAENASQEVGNHVERILQGWKESHELARTYGVPSVIVTHGTVSGSKNEHGVPMAGLDHEFTTGMLFAAEADAVMLGHIHKHQDWLRRRGVGMGHQIIAYPGSIGRLHFGEMDPKGFLIWDIEPWHPGYRFIRTPARELLEVEFEGAPDMAELRRIASERAHNAHVRIRYRIDEEHRSSVERSAIKRLFLDAGAEAVKIEGRINPVVRTRAEGISRLPSLSEQLGRWGELTETDAGPLRDRLGLLERGEAEEIVTKIIAGGCDDAIGHGARPEAGQAEMDVTAVG